MQIEQDIQAAIRLLYGDTSSSNYRKVKLFPDYSLKHFKKYNLADKKVLSKVNSLDEIFDLLCRDAQVTCFSTNRLDKYFLELLLELHNIDRKNYLDFIFKDYGRKNKLFYPSMYRDIKDELSESTRYFFDEMYKYSCKKSMCVSRLVEEQKYSKIDLERFVANYLNHKYKYIKENKQLTCYDLNDIEAINTFKEGTFNFINLSYPIDKMDYKKLKTLLQREKEFEKLLQDNGKIQTFVSREKENIKDHKVIETRSLIDTKTQGTDCKKDYAYVYTKIQQ